MAKSNVVIVGAGAAGVHTFTTLAKKIDRSKYNLVLLSSRAVSVWLIALLRLAVFDQTDVAANLIVPLDKLAASDTLKTGTVVAVEEAAPGEGGHVVLESGERFPYAVLVLAPGSIWEGPLDIPQDPDKIREHLAQWRERFAAAKEVVIAGGGAVGYELAGELRDLSPSKKVTIVHSGSQLFNDTYPDKFRRFAERSMAERGVNIVYNDAIDVFPEPDAVGVTTRNGKHFDADLVVATRGGRPNSGFIASLGPGVLAASGHVKVEETLQVKGHPDVFAAGDVIDWKEQKQAFKTGHHAAVIAANVLARLASQAPKKLYKGSSEMIIVTNGKEGGVAYFGVLWGIVLGAWFARFLKSRTVLANKHKEFVQY